MDYFLAVGFSASGTTSHLLVARSYGRVERFEVVVEKVLGDLER